MQADWFCAKVRCGEEGRPAGWYGVGCVSHLYRPSYTSHTQTEGQTHDKDGQGPLADALILNPSRGTRLSEYQNEKRDTEKHKFLHSKLWFSKWCYFHRMRAETEVIKKVYDSSRWKGEWGVGLGFDKGVGGEVMGGGGSKERSLSGFVERGEIGAEHPHVFYPPHPISYCSREFPDKVMPLS